MTVIYSRVTCRSLPARGWQPQPSGSCQCVLYRHPHLKASLVRMGLRGLTMMSHEKLPIELWGMIIAVADRETQKTCLFVSSFFHRLALPAVFETIVFHYGRFGYDNSLPTYGEARKKRVAEQCQRNQALLKCIVASPSLAQAIKNFSVRWYERCLTIDELAAQLSMFP